MGNIREGEDSCIGVANQYNQSVQEGNNKLRMWTFGHSVVKSRKVVGAAV